jgi:soluble cytochrome b562
MEQIVRRGRIKGFIPWVITQRPAVISKDILSQVDGLVAMKLTASQDRKAIGDWVKAQADEGQWQRIDTSLPAMQRGHGVLWLPGRGILETVAFPSKLTFDSSRTPERGEKRQSFDLRPLNLESLKTKLAAIEDEAKGNDPAALKSEVSRLTRELAKAQKAIAAPPPPEKIIANEADMNKARAEGVQQGIAQCRDALAAMGEGKAVKAKPAVPQVSFERVAAEPMSVVAADGVTGPQQRILNALSWWKAFGHEAVSNEQAAFIAGYSPNSGGYNNPRGGLKSLGLVDYPSPGMVALTASGEAKAATPSGAPTGEELRQRVLAKLNGPQQRILSVVIAAYPNALSNEEAAGQAGYTPNSGGYNNPRGSLKSLCTITYPQPGHVRASDWLFP